jgi:uncharacterized damage-inducible protein DinB
MPSGQRSAGEAADQLIRYSVWANRRLLACCTALTPEQVTRDLKCSHNSVLNTLWHIYDGEYFWCDNLTAGTIPPLARFGETSPVTGIEPDFGKLRERWPGVGDRLLELCRSLTADDWSVEVTCDLPDGGQMRLSRAEVAMHMVNHSTLHRGQVVSMLRQLGVKPVNVDLWEFYLSQVGAGS